MTTDADGGLKTHLIKLFLSVTRSRQYKSRRGWEVFTNEVCPLNSPVFTDVLKKATFVNSLLKSVHLNPIVVYKNLMNTANKNKL